MLKVFSGAFHPDLEQAFVERLGDLKKDPFIPVAVVAPSSRLAGHLKKRLTDGGLSLLNVHFHTLASFSESVVLSETELDKPLLSDPLFFDALVKIILREDRPFEGMAADIAVPEGFPLAVRSTLRDLLDAGIDEKNVQEAIRENFVGREVDLGTLRSLLRLHHLYLMRLSSLPVSSRADLLKQATQSAPSSNWLSQFKEVLYYGFYDMTGNQADFFEAVSKHHSSSFFFPYVKDHPAYAFAKRFRDSYLQRVMGEERHPGESRHPAFQPKEKDWTPAFAGVTAKAIEVLNVSGLRDEAWFVASEINRLHQEEKIPFSKIGVIARAQNRLTASLPKTLKAADIPYSLSVKESLFDLPAVQTAHEFLCSDENVSGWPDKTKWSIHGSHARRLLNDRKNNFSVDEDIWGLLLQGLKDMDDFDLLSGSVKRDEFLDTLRDRWTRMVRPKQGESEAGVSLLYAEAARGLPFEVVFLLGVEEKVFPRVIREDPFLRDDARFALNDALGHKIGQKLVALEEERLLFELFTKAASKRLYLTYQRSDDEGAVVGPSTFLRAYMEQNGLSMEKDVRSIPRPALAKLSEATPSTLSRQDVVAGFLYAGREKDALEAAKEDGRTIEDLKRGLFAQAALHSFDNPGPYDGQVGKREANIFFRGGKISPTALEVYGLCPFKYFATRILNLKPKEESVIDEALAAGVRGSKVHDVLEEFYRRLTQNGVKSLPPKFPARMFDDVFDTMVGKIKPGEVNLHPVLWQAVKTNLKEMLHQSVEDDYQECIASGFQPAFFEAEETTTLDVLSKEEVWNGTMDRIDLSGREARIVDYKTGRVRDLNSVAKAALQGIKSQAPAYLLLAESLFKRLKKNVSGISFVYLFVFDGNQARILTSEDWKTHKAGIVDTIKQQVAQIRSGNFVHYPDDYCSFCEVKPICRVNHSISTYRARQGAGEAVRAIRKKSVKVKTGGQNR